MAKWRDALLMVSVTRVPSPGLLWIVRSPPILRARSSMPRIDLPPFNSTTSTENLGAAAESKTLT